MPVQHLLTELLLDCSDVAVPEFRYDLLELMSTPGTEAEGFGAGVAARQSARQHVGKILSAVNEHPDPTVVLRNLCTALSQLAGPSRVLPWIELVVLVLTEDETPVADLVLRTVRLLWRDAERSMPPSRVMRCAARCSVTTSTGERPTLSTTLLRLVDRHGADRLSTLGLFLAGVADELSDSAPALAHELTKILGEARLVTRAQHGARAPAGSRLIVQIRIEPQGPAHLDAEHLLLRAAYYWQERPGADLQPAGVLAQPAVVPRGELTAKELADLVGWEQLTADVGRAAGNVRFEVLLPLELLGYEAELWKLDPNETPLGQHFPVVVRSLERYRSRYMNAAPWRHRWDRLMDSLAPQTGDRDGNTVVDTAASDGTTRQGEPAKDCDALAGIQWPVRELQSPADLAAWLLKNPDVACLGLIAPYDELHPDARTAVKDALFMEGVPVLLWRRTSGDHQELVSALRRCHTISLPELPEAVLWVRRESRHRPQDDVGRHITLLWDDPYCVHTAQDSLFEGMT
ncbi:hypothetical protein ACFYNL_19285 [Streptomyces sp. NPDC007808]|uniref:VMAP-C domain-containing protein n=1 Tax=Streptomyces sp. NPDC007808 TaxID=3364779 RepID=UPI0036AE4947